MCNLLQGVLKKRLLLGKHLAALSLLSVLCVNECNRALSQVTSPTHVQLSQPDRPPVVSFDTLFQRHLKELTSQQRKNFILQMAQSGRFFNVPELWQIDDPKIVLRAVTQFSEPLQPVMLEALERSLPKLSSLQEKDLAAAILYRYRRKSGESFLKDSLIRNNDLLSATILTENQDPSILTTVLKLYLSNPQRSMSLVPYLSYWKSPLIGPALLVGFKSDQENAIYATALAEQFDDLSKENRLRVISLIRKQYNLASPFEPAKIVAAAALVKVGADPQGDMFNFLTSAIQSKRTSSFNKYEIIEQLKFIRSQHTIPLLEKILKDFTESSLTSIQEQRNNSGQVISDDIFATCAAESLAYLHAASSKGDISTLLEKLYNTDSSPELWERAARSLLDLGGSQAVIIKIMGNNWLSEEIAKRHLRSLPSNIYPINSFVPQKIYPE